MLAKFVDGTLWAFIIMVLIVTMDMLFSLSGPRTWEEEQIRRITEAHHGKKRFHK